MFLVSVAAWIAIAIGCLLLPLQFQPTVPIAAVETLKRTDIKGTIFCDPEFGGIIIDNGYPHWKVTSDSRWYRYSAAEWLDFRRTSSGPVRLSDLDHTYDPAAYVLIPSRSAALIRALRAEPEGWREIYADRISVVFVKKPHPTRRQ